MAALVERLQRRRAGSEAEQIEVIARADGTVTYVAAGQALLSRAAVERGLSVQRLRELGLRLLDPDPAGDVVLVVAADSSADERSASDIVAQLRAAETEGDADSTTTAASLVSLNYLLPLAGFIKADGGAEPSPTGRPFPAVRYPARGATPIVAVIDTGISAEARSDGYLEGLVEPDNLEPLDAAPFPRPDQKLDVGSGHGSFVTGIVQQVAPTARLRVFRVTGPDGFCSDLELARVIRRAGADGVDVINLSLGTTTLDDAPPRAMLSAIRAVLREHERTLFVVAAGNDGDRVPMWPAALSATGPGPVRLERVIAVAGLDPHAQPSAFSSRGDWVTCSAIGRGVLSTYVIGTEDGELIGDPRPDTFGSSSWAFWTGTSFAAPQVAGAIARRCEEHGETPLEAMHSLLRDSVATPDWGHRLTILPGRLE